MMEAIAALTAAIAIAAGAFAAHAAPSPQAAEWLRTGGTYQLIHAVAALALLRWPGTRLPVAIMLGGAALFAATLYAMAFGGARWLGAVTPLGGAAMIVAWLIAAFRLWRR